MNTMDRVLLILACTLAFLLIGSFFAVVFSERFMSGGGGSLTIILGTAGTVLTTFAGATYFARDVRRAASQEQTQANNTQNTNTEAVTTATGEEGNGAA